MAEAWLVEAARALWSRVGSPAPERRDPEELALFGRLDTTPVPLPELTLGLVREWLRPRGQREPDGPDRKLHGCLVTGNPTHFAFLNATESERDQRYTLAHELAHLWIEVLVPRERARAALGDRVLEVFAGRPPTARERAYCLLHRLELGVTADLMARDAELGLTDGSICLAESRADRLALELLAPEEEALALLPDPAPWAAWLAAAEARLVETFRLPDGVARAYARRLGPRIGVAPTFRERLAGVR